MKQATHARVGPVQLMLFGLAGGCGGSGSGPGDGPAAPTLTLVLTRVPSFGLDAVRVTATVSSGEGVPTLAVDRGGVDVPLAMGGGVFSATVTPTTTGEHRVTATLGSTIVARTALVLEDVHADWGQPLAVEGLVNTDGYEDGITIAPGGEYLFVQYGPYRWSSLLVFNEPRANGGCGGHRLVPDRCSHPWVDTTLGPLGAPERPGFFTGRFSGTTQLHNAASWGIGIDESPILALTTMFYGFRRQADGSFAEPFFLSFDDLGDGIIGPFGLSFLPLGGAQHVASFALRDSINAATSFDVFTCEVEFGRDNILGTYIATTPGNPPTRGMDFPSTMVDLGDNSGTQGNPSLYTVNGAVRSIWTDDEYDGDGDTGSLSVHVLESGTFPTSNDYTRLVLPSIVNVPGTVAIQPTFTDEGLYFTQDVSVVFAAYSSTHDSIALADAGNWTAPEGVLLRDTSIAGPLPTTNDVGKIIAIGEPTVATIGGRTVLYFVYAWVRGIDPITGLADLDFQAGFVEQND